MRNFNFCKVGCFSKMEENFENFFCQPFVYGQRCFVPKNHDNWPYRFGDIATIPSKTWFFTNFTFLAFLTHPNDQKMFRRARSQFFHVLKHQKNFRQNWGTFGPKVYGPALIQSKLKTWCEYWKKVKIKYLQECHLLKSSKTTIEDSANWLVAGTRIQCKSCTIICQHWQLRMEIAVDKRKKHFLSQNAMNC